MDVTNATIEWIGEIEKMPDNREKIAIDVSTASSPKKRYVIWKNKNHAFDLLKDFKINHFKVGDKIDFDYNEPTGRWYPTIWRIANHKRKNN